MCLRKNIVLSFYISNMYLAGKLIHADIKSNAKAASQHVAAGSQPVFNGFSSAQLENSSSQ